MGINSSSRADAGEIVTVDPGPGRSSRQHASAESQDPLLKRLAQLKSVRLSNSSMRLELRPRAAH